MKPAYYVLWIKKGDFNAITTSSTAGPLIELAVILADHGYYVSVTDEFQCEYELRIAA